MRVYALPLSGKVARRVQYSNGVAILTADDDGQFRTLPRCWIQRNGPSGAWQVWSSGEVVLRTYTLSNALQALDREEAAVKIVQQMRAQKTG